MEAARRAKRPPADPSKMGLDRPLTAKEERFVEEYLVDLNATAAAERAGYRATTPNSMRTRAWQLMQRPRVQEALAARRDKLSQQSGVTAQAIIERLWEIATADPQQIMQLRRKKCSACKGSGGNDIEQCEVCGGEGTVSVPWFEDTRNLTGPARKLFAGLKVTERGIEVRTHQQMHALELLGKHFGLFTDKIDHRLIGKNGQPVEPVVLAATDPIEAAKAYQRLMNGE